MNFLNIFNEINKNNNVLVVPNELKNKIVSLKTNYELSSKQIFLFKILTVNELIELLSFSYDDEIYLANLNNNNQAFSITKELIHFSRYNLNKTNLELNNFLKNNDTFIKLNTHFINISKDLVFNVLGSSVLLEPFFNYYQLNYNNIELIKEKKHVFRKFQTKEQELFFIMEEISKLLDGGTNINNIYLSNISSNDYTLVKRIAGFYNINILLNNPVSLFNIPYINDLLNNSLEQLKSLLTDNEELIETYYDIYKVDSESFNNNINLLINIINKYPFSNYSDDIIYKVIKEEVKNSFVSEKIQSNVIKVITPTEIISLHDDSYVFILNAAYEFFPVLAKDSNYLSDESKELINYPTSTFINLANNQLLKEIINLSAVKHISFSLKDEKLEYAASDIFSSNFDKTSGLTVIDENLITKGYAKKYYQTYFSKNHESNLQSTFDPSFKINEEEIIVMKEYILKKELKLTPTDISKYLQLPFVYYLERVIGLSSFEKNVSLNLGNFFHTIVEVLFMVFFEEKVDRSRDLKDNQNHKYVYDDEIHQDIFNYIVHLDESDKDNFDYDLFFIEFFNIYFKKDNIKLASLNSNKLSKEDELLVRTLFYIKKHQEVITTALRLLIDLEQQIESKILIIEKSIEVDNFKGTADLIKIYDDNTFSIIDYKTGDREAFNLSKIDTLLDKLLKNDNSEISLKALDLIQLVLYSYLLTKSYDDLKLKDLAYYSYFKDKLNGITTGSFNANYYTSTKTRIITDEEELNELYEKIEQLLVLTVNNIMNANFNLNIRLDEKDKKGLDQTHFSVYEAIMFNSEEGSIDDEDN